MKVFRSALVFLSISTLVYGFAAVPRFQKISDHFYFLESQTGFNVGAMITEEAVLLINPPAPSDVQAVLDALRRVTPKPVRWVVSTDPLIDRAGGAAHLIKLGAVQLASMEQFESGLAARGSTQEGREGRDEESRPYARNVLLFGSQLRLYPSAVEVRILSVGPAYSSGDVVIYLPSEKVLQVGDLFVAGSFPEIVMDAGGSALGWLGAAKKIVDAVPLLKAAIPQPKPDPARAPEEEKTLEEMVTVICGRGPRSNLQELKIVLEAAQKARTEIGRSASLGRARGSIQSLPGLGSYRSMKNFESYTLQLFDELAKK